MELIKVHFLDKGTEEREEQGPLCRSLLEPVHPITQKPVIEAAATLLCQEDLL